MSFAAPMARTHPRPKHDSEELIACIRACFDCAQSCTACADACLAEVDPKPLARCIHLNLDCADLCAATGRIISRQTAFDPELAAAALRACETACRLCADECESHPGMEHCRICGEACRQCEQACEALLGRLAA